jgi:hypothetical protein
MTHLGQFSMQCCHDQTRGIFVLQFPGLNFVTMVFYASPMLDDLGGAPGPGFCGTLGLRSSAMLSPLMDYLRQTIASITVHARKAPLIYMEFMPNCDGISCSDQLMGFSSFLLVSYQISGIAICAFQLRFTFFFLDCPGLPQVDV